MAIEGTLARAAEQLCIVPTAVSAHIAQLEAHIGGELFDRSVRPMALTPLGRFFLPRARELLSLCEGLDQEARDVAAGKRGWVAVGFVRSLIYSVLPSAVQAFRQQHPDAKIDLVELFSDDQPAQLRQDRIQIGLSRLTRHEKPLADLTHTTLFEDPFVAAVSAAHPLAKRRTVELERLDQLPFINYHPNSSYAAYVLDALRQSGGRPKVGHEAVEIHTALGLVAAGLGYTVVGSSVATRGPTDIRYLKLPQLKARTWVVAVSRAGELPPLAASLLSSLVAAARGRQAIGRGSMIG